MNFKEIILKIYTQAVASFKKEIHTQKDWNSTFTYQMCGLIQFNWWSTKIDLFWVVSIISGIQNADYFGVGLNNPLNDQNNFSISLVKFGFTVFFQWLESVNMRSLTWEILFNEILIACNCHDNIVNGLFFKL